MLSNPVPSPLQELPGLGMNDIYLEKRENIPYYNRENVTDLVDFQEFCQSLLFYVEFVQIGIGVWLPNSQAEADPRAAQD